MPRYDKAEATAKRVNIPADWGGLKEEDLKDATFMGHDAKAPRYVRNKDLAPGRFAASGMLLVDYLKERGWYECNDEHVVKKLAPVGGSATIRKVTPEAEPTGPKMTPGRKGLKAKGE